MDRFLFRACPAQFIIKARIFIIQYTHKIIGVPALLDVRHCEVLEFNLLGI